MMSSGVSKKESRQHKRKRMQDFSLFLTKKSGASRRMGFRKTQRKIRVLNSNGISHSQDTSKWDLYPKIPHFWRYGTKKKNV
jgi:hypothetical protein